MKGEYGVSLPFDNAHDSEKSGQLSDVEQYYKDLLKHMEASGYGDMDTVAYCLGCILFDTEKYEESLKYLKQMFSVYDKKYSNRKDILVKLAAYHSELVNF